MVFNVRCFKCGEQEVRLILGGRAILHARCHACDSNLLAEVMAFQEEIEAADQPKESGEADRIGDAPLPQSQLHLVSDSETGEGVAP